MRRLLAVLCVIAPLITAAPALAAARDDARAQVAFGIEVAARGLWREAIYRWQRAVEIDPSYAEAFNDLAIAWEHEGELDKARQAYEQALKLSPSNPAIKQNFEQFKEVNARAVNPARK